MPSEIERVIARERQKLAENEARARGRMQDTYRRQVETLMGDLTLLTNQIDAARRNGTTVNPDWLRKQTRYVHLIQQADDLFAQFSRDGVHLLQQNVLDASTTGLVSGQAMLNAVGIDFGSNVNTQATERLTMSLDPDSPLRPVIDSYGDQARSVIVGELVDGMARGDSPRKMIANIRRRMTDEAGPRLDTLVRTEMMRSYRGSLFDQFEGQVSRWRWTAAHSRRTCLACLALSGQIFPMTTGFMPSHPNCRCIPSPVPERLYGEEPETGPEWFARQDPDVRRSVMSKEAADAYDSGDLALADFVDVRHNDLWGTSVQEKSSRQALADRRAKGKASNLPIVRPADAPKGTGWPVAPKVKALKEAA